MTDAGHDGRRKGKEKMMSMFIDKQEILEEEHFLIQKIITDYGTEPDMAFKLIAGANLCVKRMLDLLLEKEEAYCDRVATVMTRGSDVQ